jgi:hypothetical protein
MIKDEKYEKQPLRFGNFTMMVKTMEGSGCHFSYRPFDVPGVIN